MLTYPVVAADFLDLLPVKSISLELPETSSYSRTAAGEIIAADLGARLWQGTVTLGRLLRHEASEAQTLIDALRVAGASFMAYDLARPWPRLDPGGAILGASTPTIYALGGTARELRLAGLPVGYQLRRGDRVAFSYGASPTRYALHRIVTATAAADGAGRTPLLEVIPPLRPGVTAGAAVSLLSPACKAVIVPGSVQPGQTDRHISDGASFQFIQTLR